MENASLVCGIEKMYLIALALDEFLSAEYPTLLHETGAGCRRALNTLSTGLGELRHGLEALQTFPVDKAGDSGYDKREVHG